AGLPGQPASVPATTPVDDSDRRRRVVSSDIPVTSRLPHSASALYPQLRLPGPVVGALDVPVLAERVVIHRGHEIEGRLELDVVEPGIGGDQLMPFAGRNQHQAAGTNWKAAAIVLHFAGAFFDQIEVLRYDRARLR